MSALAVTIISIALTGVLSLITGYYKSSMGKSILASEGRQSLQLADATKEIMSAIENTHMRKREIEEKFLNLENQVDAVRSEVAARNKENDRRLVGIESKVFG